MTVTSYISYIYAQVKRNTMLYEPCPLNSYGKHQNSTMHHENQHHPTDEDQTWHTFQRPEDMHPRNVSINHVTGEAAANMVTCQTSVTFLPAFFVVVRSVQTQQLIPSVDGPNDGACDLQCCCPSDGFQCKRACFPNK
jgi:hypothetical protein